MLATIDSSSMTAKLVARSSRTLFMGGVISFSASLDRGAPAKFQERLSPFLGNDIRGGVGVAGGDPRHDRGVDDAQPAEAAHPQLVVDDRERVAPHLAGADGVEDGRAELA